MRTNWVSLALLTAVATGCHCGQHLNGLQPGLVIVEPTARAGSDWLINFGSASTTGAAMSQPIRIENHGEAPATISSFALRAGSDAAYALGSITLPQTVAPGGFVEVQVTYTPKHAGGATGFVDIQTTDPKLTTATVDLVATGDVGEVQVCVQNPMTGAWTCNALEGAGLSIDFGFVLVGSPPVARQVQVRNIGNANLQYLGTALSASSSPEFSFNPSQTLPSGGSAIAPNAVVQFAVMFTPQASSMAMGSAVVSTSDPSTPTVTIQLTANAAASQNCHITVTPTPMDFGAVPANGFAQQTLVIVDDGLMPCTVSGLTLSGSAAFTLVSPPTLPLTLQPNGISSVGVHYVPSGSGTDMGTLTVASSDPVNPSIAVPLSGTTAAAAPCQIQAIPGSVVFSQAGVGTMATQTVQFWNFGTDTCIVASAAMKPGSSASFTASTGVLQIPAIDSNMSYPVTVTYFPHAPSNLDTGELDLIAGNSILALGTTKVPVSGTAVAPCLNLTPPSLAFGTVAAGTTHDLSFQVGNCGATALEVRGLYLQAGSSAAFTVTQIQTSSGTTATFPSVIAPGTSDTVTVHYAPTVSTGDFGQVAIANDSNTPVAYEPLSGNTTCGGPVLSCTPTALVFPNTATGQVSTKTFTCTNAGSQTVTISGISLQAATSPEFSLSVPAVTSLAPGQMVRVAVDFAPNVAGVATGAVEVDSNACITKQLVSLNAMGFVPNYPPCPMPTVFQPVVKWSWTTGNGIDGVDGQPMVSPLIDTNGDGRVDEQDIPAVVFPASTQAFISNLDAGVDPSPPGVLHAIRGDNGHDIWSVTDKNYAVFSTYQLAIGDIDGDNIPEIVTGLYYESPGSGAGGFNGKFVTGRLIAFHNDGSVKWISDWWTNGNVNDIEDDSAISIADLDADGVPEIIIGSAVFDSDGRLLWQGTKGRGNMYHGSVSAIADLDGDGKAEVIGGNTAYHSDGSIYWTYGTTDAFPIVVDVDGDGKPEVVLRTDYDQFVVLNSDGTVKYGPINFNVPTMDANGNQVDICTATITAADFDGDGLPEIGIPAGIEYFMFKPDGGLMWTAPIQDYIGQCGAAGTGAFDFFGKGAFAAVYNDAQAVYAFDGKTGNVIYQQPRNSATIIEVPVIADVDNDGHADIVIDQDGSPQIVALSNSGNDWPATRGTWNQHTYHVTNVTPSGGIPRVEGPGWQTFNAYRANVALCK